MELNEKWKLTTQNNGYLWEGNQISKQNRYPWYIDCMQSAERFMADHCIKHHYVKLTYTQPFLVSIPSFLQFPWVVFSFQSW